MQGGVILKLNQKSTKEGVNKINNTVKGRPSRMTYKLSEDMIRLKVQDIQETLKEEVEGLLGRKKSERTKVIDRTAGYRNGYEKPKRFRVVNGIVTVLRPRGGRTEISFTSGPRLDRTQKEFPPRRRNFGSGG